MYKVNTLFGRKVVSASSGEQLGAVRDVVLDAEARTIVALIVGGGGWLSKDRAVRWGQISSLGEFVVVEAAGELPLAGEDAEVEALRRQAEPITGKRVVTAAGEQLGTVADMLADGRGRILGFELKHGLFGAAPVLRAVDVQTIGRDAIIAATAELSTVEAMAASLERAGTTQLRGRALGEPGEPGEPK